MQISAHRLVKNSLAAVAVMVSLATSSAFAQNAPQLIDVFGKWEAYSYTEKGKKVCYIGSQPVSAKGDYSQRGKIYVMVTHRPALKLFNEVSFITGYAYKKDSDVELRIDSTPYKLFTYEDSAWAVNGEEDRKMVRSMKSGSNMTVVGYSTRGTKTTDTYSLSGFTAAYNAISKACDTTPVS
ncbi:invasion associated locus B family protein [Thalassospira sp.]|uniref:invasion associated locus B family protein n=1 Tax=Thalassospira sp. TaxID=1912094 RepID=UPI002736C279|nr:invasion associated locus B family protein [Thalassospira sp.]MDP2699267.1 invasion associated locus B family protein [Thalassospira sp.]